MPSQAVQTGQDGQYVFVVKGDSTVEQRAVTPGQRVDDDIVIEKGLKTGETMVTEGQLRLEPGSRVTTDRADGAVDVDAAAEAVVERPARPAAGRARRAAPILRRPQPATRAGGVTAEYAGTARKPPSVGASRLESGALVNISEVFIRRPIATSLLMVGDRAVRRRRVPRAAGQRSAAGRLSDHQRQRRPARRRSRDDGLVGREPARAPVHDDRRPRLDDVAEQLRQHQYHAAVRSRPRHRQRGRRRADGDRRGDAAAAVRACRRRRRSARRTRPTSRS